MGWGRGRSSSRFPSYVSVADRKKKAGKLSEKLKKEGQEVDPIVIDGKSITKTFWGNAWCKNLESYSDYKNRLPRGRSYIRHGAVLDLKVSPGEINALVSGSSVYKVKVAINKVVIERWNNIVDQCAGKIDSVIELLQGKFSKAVMEIITDSTKGLFPHPKEIKLNCSCPDWADMCKHVAAVLYGVGARLDNRPEELFLLRQADHLELISQASAASLTKSSEDQSDQILVGSDLSALFGIDLGDAPTADVPRSSAVKTKKKTAKVKTKPAKKIAKKKTVVATKKKLSKAKAKKVTPKQ